MSRVSGTSIHHHSPLPTRRSVAVLPHAAAIAVRGPRGLYTQPREALRLHLLLDGQRGLLVRLRQSYHETLLVGEEDSLLLAALGRAAGARARDEGGAEGVGADVGDEVLEVLDVGGDAGEARGLQHVHGDEVLEILRGEEARKILVGEKSPAGRKEIGGSGAKKRGSGGRRRRLERKRREICTQLVFTVLRKNEGVAGRGGGSRAVRPKLNRAVGDLTLLEKELHVLNTAKFPTKKAI